MGWLKFYGMQNRKAHFVDSATGQRPIDRTGDLIFGVTLMQPVRIGNEFYVTVSLAEGAPQRINGYMSASAAPGLGIVPRMDVLGEPVVEIV